MSQNPNDPAGTTQQFENFARQGGQQQPVKSSGVNTGLIVGVVAVGVVIVIAVGAFLMV